MPCTPNICLPAEERGCINYQEFTDVGTVSVITQPLWHVHSKKLSETYSRLDAHLLVFMAALGVILDDEIDTQTAKNKHLITNRTRSHGPRMIRSRKTASLGLNQSSTASKSFEVDGTVEVQIIILYSPSMEKWGG